jgi:hypothetical protein
MSGYAFQCAGQMDAYVAGREDGVEASMGNTSMAGGCGQEHARDTEVMAN